MIRMITLRVIVKGTLDLLKCVNISLVCVRMEDSTQHKKENKLKLA